MSISLSETICGSKEFVTNEKCVTKGVSKLCHQGSVYCMRLALEALWDFHQLNLRSKSDFLVNLLSTALLNFPFIRTWLLQTCANEKETNRSAYQKLSETSVQSVVARISDIFNKNECFLNSYQKVFLYLKDSKPFWSGATLRLQDYFSKITVKKRGVRHWILINSWTFAQNVEWELV